MSTTFTSMLKWLVSIVVGTFWCWIEPTIPFAAICLFAVVLDCISAWRLNRRVKIAYPNGGADGKFKSTHAFKMIGDLLIVFGCIVLAFHVDRVLFPYQTFYLGQTVAAIFCFVEFWSILENESSCSDKKWAQLIQQYVVDKTERHLEISLDEYKHVEEVENSTIYKEQYNNEDKNDNENSQSEEASKSKRTRKPKTQKQEEE